MRGFATVGSVCIEIIEGNPHLRSLLGWHLQQLDYRVFQAASIYQAREAFLTHQPTLVVLDADLPDGDGIEFCRWLNRQQQPLILMLSARNSEADIVTGLKAGADDYLSKPFSMRELVARCRALLRRQRLITTSEPPVLNYKEITLYPQECRVLVRKEEVNLSPKEFRLLELFMSYTRRVWSREQLLDQVWGPDFVGDSKTVDVHIRWLREKLEQEPSRPEYIVTVRGFGYRFG